MFSVCVVGTVQTDIKPGDIVLIDQFLDLTKGRRPDTFFDEEGELRHTDMTYPYSGKLQELGGRGRRARGHRSCASRHLRLLRGSAVRIVR